MSQFNSTQQSPTLKKYRELLGVAENASPEELKKAYHQRAFLYHPDRNQDPNAAEQFQQIREAFDCLSDPDLVASMKRNHLKEQLFDVCIEGLQISFGAFFGHRVFVSGDPTLPREKRIGQDVGPDPQTPATGKVYIEEDRSVLDHPAFDSIEVVYAGKFSNDDEDRLLADVKMNSQGQLPWVLLNNKGIIDFLNRDYKRALKCYEDLNQRMPNNIIFLYREALCHIVLGFQNPKRNIFGVLRPDKKNIQKGIQLFRRCIRIGETRSVGRQKCLVIRKILADVLDKVGRRRAAKSLWKEILKEQPRSVEASLKSGAYQQAVSLIEKKSKARVSTQSLHRALLPDKRNSNG